MQEQELLTKLEEKQLHCTGCGGCANVCLTRAITMLPDELGFYRPQIKQDVCVDCKACVRTCPVLNDFPNHNFEQPACYAVQACDAVRKKSSSGGVFTLLAEKVLADGGAVAGVVMDADLSVHHVCIRGAEELDRLRKSKYVQSDVKSIYREVRTILEQGGSW